MRREGTDAMTTNITTATRTAAAWIERRLLLDLLLPADTTPTDAIAVVGRALSDASVEIAERDEIIGRRDDDLTAARATNGVMEASLREAIADLNATREKLSNAVADRDAAAAEAATLRDERADLIGAIVGVGEVVGGGLGPAGDERDHRVWARYARSLTDRADALRARVAELEARPVLTAERLAEQLATHLSFDDGRHAKGPATRILAALGAVTLSAQDRAEELARRMADAMAAMDAGSDERPWSALDLDTRNDRIVALRFALREMGAPEVTPALDAADADGDARRYARSSEHAGYLPSIRGIVIDGVDATIMGAMLRASGPVAVDDVTLLAMSRAAVAALDALNAPAKTPTAPPPAVAVDSANGPVAASPFGEG